MAKDWWKASAQGLPKLVTELPGPKSRALHPKAARYMKGLSEQVLLFPVCFEEGHGIMLKDVDGNEYLDFSSGIYVTSLGHCHPKVSEAVAHWARMSWGKRAVATAHSSMPVWPRCPAPLTSRGSANGSPSAAPAIRREMLVQ